MNEILWQRIISIFYFLFCFFNIPFTKQLLMVSVSANTSVHLPPPPPPPFKIHIALTIHSTKFSVHPVNGTAASEKRCRLTSNRKHACPCVCSMGTPSPLGRPHSPSDYLSMRVPGTAWEQAPHTKGRGGGHSTQFVTPVGLVPVDSILMGHSSYIHIHPPLMFTLFSLFTREY